MATTEPDELWSPDRGTPYNLTQISALMQAAVQEALLRANPTGVISPFAGETAPEGSLLCLGQEVSRTEEARLFSVIGTFYGAGDGSTTFNVPNGRGRVLVGFDGGQAEFNQLGKTGGEKAHTLTVDELATHSHGQDAHDHYIDGPLGGQLSGMNGGPGAGGSSSGYFPWYGGGYGAQPANVSDAAPGIHNTGSGHAHNNLQPYLVTNYIIKT